MIWAVCNPLSHGRGEGVIIVKVLLFDCVVAAQFNGMHALWESQLRSSQRKSVVFFVSLCLRTLSSGVNTILNISVDNTIESANRRQGKDRQFEIKRCSIRKRLTW